MIYPAKVKKVSNEVVINDVFDYGDKIMGCVKHKSGSSYIYLEVNVIAFVLEQKTSKRKRLSTKIIGDTVLIFFKS